MSDAYRQLEKRLHDLHPLPLPYFFYRQEGEILFLYSPKAGRHSEYTAYLFGRLSKEVDEGDYMGEPGLNRDRGSIWYMLTFSLDDSEETVARKIKRAIKAMENDR